MDLFKYNPYILQIIINKFFITDYSKLALISKKFNQIIHSNKRYQELLEYYNNQTNLNKIKFYALILKYGNPMVLSFDDIYRHVYFTTLRLVSHDEKIIMINNLNDYYIANLPYSSDELRNLKDILSYPLRIFSQNPVYQNKLHPDLLLYYRIYKT